MYKAALFDMDGLIFDTERSIKKCWQKASLFQQLHIDDGFYSQFIGVKDSECEQLLKTYFANDHFDLDKFKADRDALIDSTSKNGIAIKEGFDALFTQLIANKIKLALVTSSSLQTVKKHFRHLEYLEHFQVIVTGESVYKSKPHPEGYLKAIKSLKVQASECVVFEDSNNGMLAGLSAGCDCIMVPDLTKPNPSVSLQAKAIVPSLAHAIAFL